MTTPRARFRAEVVERDPFLCRLLDDKCIGLLAADHILRVQPIERYRGEILRRLAQGETITPPQRRLAEAELDTLIADARNGWLLCELHHGAKDRKLLEVPASKIPPDFFEFVAEYGLEVPAARNRLMLS